MSKTKKGRSKYSTISLLAPIMEEVEKVVKTLGYWPTKSDFIREAVIEKLEKSKKELKNEGKKIAGNNEIE